MATRADRLNDRLRGAQRVIVEDDDTFGLNIPGIAVPAIATEEPAAPANATTRSTPGSAKRQKTDRASSSRPRPSQDASSGRKSTRSRPQTSSSLADVPEERSTTLITAATTRPRRSSAAATSSPAAPIAPNIDDTADDLEALPAPRSSKSPASRRRSSRRSTDEVEESPVNAPGSGRRITRNAGGASESSTRLQDVLGSDEPAASSSPSARVAKRRSAAPVVAARPGPTPAKQSTLRQETIPDEEDELSPDRVRGAPASKEVAEEAMAPTTTRRKRGRRSLSRQSPELGSESPEAAEEAEEVEEPAPKRNRGRHSVTPAAQRQPGARTGAKPKATKRASQGPMKRATKAKETGRTSKASPMQRKRRSAATQGTQDDDEAADDDNAAIEITVQRFVNYRKPGGAGADDEDPLHSEIPFANRTGESTVDVFAQVCEEVVNNTMGQFLGLLASADLTAAKKKEFRIKMRAIDAYKEELNSRLLQHAIHLDHWYTLRKRVRHVQKEKLTLREEILKLKAEREHVALRMDSIRTKHEADTKESQYRLDASALMHEIELAVERGRKAPELSRKDQKDAELANLELLIAQVMDQASSHSSSGGLLQQVTDFNAFLERAAVALESR